MIGKAYSTSQKADTIRSAGLVFFGLYAWDFYSDAVFVIRLGQIHAWYLFVPAMLFLVVPYVLNVKHLFEFQKQWMADPSISEYVTGWLINYSLPLVITTMISGSVFASIELFNTNLFGMDMFSMGLPERQVKKCATQRLFSNILMENTPQIILQALYAWLYMKGFSSANIDKVVVYAFASSLVSIGIAIIDLWSSFDLLQSIKEDNLFFLQGSNSGENRLSNKTFFFFIEGDEIIYKRLLLRQRHWPLREAIGEALEVHPRTIELTQLIPSIQGLKIGFTIFTNFKTKNELTLGLLDAFETDNFSKSIQRSWKLEDCPKCGMLQTIVNNRIW
ncbi:hypothetical protein RFI_17729 [Reticulomyxa filosa]|uniref:Uncharacterized protein n=1 Tax=Reticulomyxa filosa TaxID=46433 RepID=X6N0C1_RETFI|nr:hypothetical protein RFI_17729 [Reticulomyxa filosa]|eukprot:ETO19501.1 hypothetical protein RFI_17729 [Reticulomyxa filosa]